MKIYEDLSLKNIEGEIWKDIKGYNGDYQISNLGRVKSFKKWRGSYVRILKQIISNSGHLQVCSLSKNGKYKPRLIHVLLFETFNNKKLKGGEIVHHSNEIKLDNDLDNFQLMTKKEHDQLHKYGKKCPEHSLRMLGKNNPMYGIHLNGEKNGHHKLTGQNVIQIKLLLKEEILTQKEIAEIFGVHRVTISAIKNGRSWKYI